MLIRQFCASIRYDAHVVTIDGEQRRVEVKYDGWAKKYNKWFAHDSKEVRASASKS